MAKRTKAADDRLLLLQMIEEAYQLPNWNGTNLRSALRRVTPEMAGWRPPHARRSIADIVVHCAYWKYALRRRLSGARRGTFRSKAATGSKPENRLPAANGPNTGRYWKTNTGNCAMRFAVPDGRSVTQNPGSMANGLRCNESSGWPSTTVTTRDKST
jgi:hypothetical protein